MKKRFSILIALVLVLAIALPVLASCVTGEKTVKSITVVSPKTEYKVGDTIDYDSLQIEITYEDDTTAKKTVKELKATVNQADLSKAGNTSYTITYSGKNTTVNVTVTAEVIVDVKNFSAVSFDGPDFYLNYKIKSADRGDADETRADFRVTGETYEVGNANKFIYKPTATGLDLEKLETVEVENAKTTVKVYSKDAKNGTYAEVAADVLADFVTIDDNTYLFTEQAAGKYVKLEISLDAEEYDVENIEEENRTLTVEFVVVDGGYNVYDQMGLSVMCDMQKNAWADLWGCKSTWDADNRVYVLSDKEGTTALKLEADDKPLYQYVGNVSYVIMHTSINLNADQLPAHYFWNSEDDEGYTAAYTSLTGFPALQAKLLGSLNDGGNNEFYYRFNDVIPGSGESPDTFLPLNMQKGLFGSCKVSVSGNYNSIIVPETASASGRTFTTVADWGDEADQVGTPVTHVSIFQIHMVESESGHEAEYTIKNLAMSGNAPKDDVGSGEVANGLPAGMMMVNCYTSNLTLNNIVANKFFTNVVVDGYSHDTGLNLLNSKMYDAYSNMFYTWRSNVNVENSDLIGAGGPVFILCDGPSSAVEEGRTDENGSHMTVDKASVLQSYATGDESWYTINHARQIVNKFKTDLEPGMNALGKTIMTEQNGLEYINIIAVIICSPGDLFAGASNYMMDVCGSYTTMDGEATHEQFAMHNEMLVQLREASRLPAPGGDGNYDARRFPIILQLGNNMAYNKGDGKMYSMQGELTQQEYGAWMMNTTHNHLGVYMSAAPVTSSRNAPYFCAIVEINQKTAD